MSGDNEFAVKSPQFTDYSQPGGLNPPKVNAQLINYCIPAALEELDQAIGRLDEELGQIYEKLDPLVRPEKDGMAKDPGDSYPAMSGVALRIYRTVDKINQMKNTLGDLRERIDL